MVNRYTQAPVATYNPMSMQELSFAPSFLRQRHDETNAAIQALNEQAGQYNVHNNFQNIAGQLVDPITQELTGLSGDLSQRGINESRGVDRLIQLNAKQKELFSPRGAIGQLQNRTQQFQEAKKELSDFFKNNPELANFKLRQANIGQATINPETGKLELGEMKIPSYVRHIADEDIMKQLNDAVKGLKPSDLARYGIQYTGSLGEFNDLFNVDRVKGVTPERIQALLGSLIGPEIQQSVAQYGEMMGYSPEESLGMLNNRLIGISNASAYQDTDSRYFNVQDDMGLYRAKKALDKEETRLSSWDYDPTTQEISVGGFDNSYFKPDYSDESININTPTGLNYPQGGYGVDPVTGKMTNNVKRKDTEPNYRQFDKAQELEAYEIISSLSGKPISEIPDGYVNTKAGRDKLKEYFDKNSGKVQVQPVIDNTDQLREYGGDPEKATKDLYANYQSRILFDVKEGRQLTPQEFERYLSDGKLEVRGVYNAENPFGFIAENADPASLASPMSVNLKDDDGKVIKTFAISRSPEYQNSVEGFYNTQINSIYNNVIRTPNIDKMQNFTLVNNAGQSMEIPMKVKFNSSNKTYTVSPISDDFNFKTFNIKSIKDIGDAIKANAN